ncbi:MAG: hypothetical protein HC802_04695 [Caldilineaceae bacterium]|nr:hypothetical protein [Caldilineaceae bacterium]
MDFLITVWSWLFLSVVVAGPIPSSILLTTTLTRRVRPGFTEILLTLVIFWVAIQTAVALALGGAGRLTAITLFAVELLLLAIGGVLLLWRRRPMVFPPPALPSRTQFVTLATLAFLGLLLTGNILIQPITDYDSLFYHLPFVAHVHGSGDLSMVGQFNGVRGYPYSWELLSTLFVFPFSSDLLIAAPNLIAWFLFGLGVYTAARLCGAGRQHSLSAILLLLSLPIVVDQVNSARVDLALAAFFLAGLFYAVRFGQTGAAGHALPWLICIGLVCGVKTSGLVYGGMLVALGLAVRAGTVYRSGPARPVPGERGKSEAFWPWLAGIGGLLLLGGFWYGRNLVTNGNPLGDVEVRLGELMLFAGSVPADELRKTTLAVMFDLANWDHWSGLAGQTVGRLSLPLVMLLGMVLALPWRAITDARRRTDRSQQQDGWIGLAWMGFLLLLLTLVYWVTPFSGDDGTNEWLLSASWLGQGFRFALPMLGCFAVLAALAASLASLDEEWSARAVIAASLITFAARSWLYLAAIILYLLVLAAVWLIRRPAQGRTSGMEKWAIGWPVGVVFCSQVVVILNALQSLHDVRRLDMYGALPRVVEQQTLPGDTIGYSLSHQSYLLYGPRLDRRVAYLPADIDDPVALREHLERHDISLVAIGPLYPTTRDLPIVALLTDPDGDFELVFADDDARPALYRLRE